MGRAMTKTVSETTKDEVRLCELAMKAIPYNPMINTT